MINQEDNCRIRIDYLVLLPLCLARQLKEILHHNCCQDKNLFELNGICVGKSYSVDVDFVLSSNCAEKLELLS